MGEGPVGIAGAVTGAGTGGETEEGAASGCCAVAAARDRCCQLTSGRSVGAKSDVGVGISARGRRADGE